MDWLEPTVRWYVTLVVLTWALAPVAWCAAGGNRWLAAAIARPLALLLTATPLWFAANLDLVPYTTVGLWLVALGLGGVAWATLYPRGAASRRVAALAVSEGVAFVAFLFYVWYHGYTPEISSWSEKPMNAAFLAASARTETMPPVDPWFVGEGINYYYYGYVVLGAVARMAGVAAPDAFNLALATTFSLATAVAAIGAYGLLRRSLTRAAAATGAALAVFLLAFAGNLLGPRRLIANPEATLSASWLDGIGWDSARVIWDAGVVAGEGPESTINEFPAFSFLISNLHPHLMALPFTVAAILLCLHFLSLVGAVEGERELVRMSIGVLAAGLIVGSLYPMNSWDFPTYAVASALCIGVGLWRRLGWRAAAAGVGGFAAAAILPYLPFLVTFDPQVNRSSDDPPGVLGDLPLVRSVFEMVGVVTWDRTSFGEFVTMFGGFYLVAVVFLAVWSWSAGNLRRIGVRVGIPAAAGCVALAVALSAPLLFWCGVPLVLAVALVVDDRMRGVASAAAGLFAAAFALVLVVEFFFIQDQGDSRKNTVFKIHYQAWTLFALGAAVALIVGWEMVRRHQPTWPRWLAAGALVVFLLPLSVYPVLAGYRWSLEFRDWQGVNGASFVGDWSPDERAAVEWLLANAETDDVILEAAGCTKRPREGIPTSRISALTGIPTVIGWGGTERLLRTGQPEARSEVRQRQEDVLAMYLDPGSPLYAQYGVTLLYVGMYEQNATDCDVAGPYEEIQVAGYPGSGWTEVFNSGEVRIFRTQAG